MCEIVESKVKYIVFFNGDSGLLVENRKIQKGFHWKENMRFHTNQVLISVSGWSLKSELRWAAGIWQIRLDLTLEHLTKEKGL